MPPVKSKRKETATEPGVRVSALIVMDAAILDRARAKAEQHNMPFPEFLEQACRLFGRQLDHKVSVIPRPI